MKMAYSVAPTLSPSQCLRGFSVYCASRTLVPHRCLIITNFVPRVSEWRSKMAATPRDPGNEAALSLCFIYCAWQVFSGSSPAQLCEAKRDQEVKMPPVTTCHLRVPPVFTLSNNLTKSTPLYFQRAKDEKNKSNRFGF